MPSGLNEVFFLNLWKKIGASLRSATSDSDFCSANGNHTYPVKPTMSENTSNEKANFTSLCVSVTGLYFLLSALLFVFTKDPHLCIPLFCDVESECVYALGGLLGTEWLVLRCLN